MTLPFTRTDAEDPSPNQDQLRAERVARSEEIRSKGLFDPPDTCPSCGATLRDSGPIGTACPHCHHDIEKYGKLRQEQPDKFPSF